MKKIFEYSGWCNIYKVQPKGRRYMIDLVPGVRVTIDNGKNFERSILFSWLFWGISFRYIKMPEEEFESYKLFMEQMKNENS